MDISVELSGVASQVYLCTRKGTLPLICASSEQGYYRNKNDRIIGSSPWEYLTYWRRTRRPELGDFLIGGRADRAESEPLVES